MKKVQDAFKTFKEIWKVPKYKGLLQIGFWVIFFIFVFIFIKTKQNVNTNTINNANNTAVEEKNQDILSYIYNYQINDNENTINISGTYYKGIDLFNYNNNRYYIKNNLYYNLEKVNIPFDYNVIEYQYNNIMNLIKDKEYESKTEYKDKTTEYTYIIDSITYNNYFHKENIVNSNIVLKVKYTNDLIDNVFIDLSEYYIDKSIYQVNINYSNINNIDGLDINIE